MLHHTKSREGYRSSPLKFFASSSVPKAQASQDSHKQWTAEFLTDLRSNRPARPSGSRPLPNRNATSTAVLNIEPPARTSSAMERPRSSIGQLDKMFLDRCTSAMSHRRVQLGAPKTCLANRSLIQPPRRDVASGDIDDSTNTSVNAPSVVYRESGQRWMEKQETRSLSRALHDMDAQNEERLHAAAQDEASELVWKHMNSGQPYKNPEALQNYKEHLRKGSHVRSQSLGLDGGFDISKNSHTQGQRSVSNSSTSADGDSEKSGTSRASSGASVDHGRPDVEAPQASSKTSHLLWDSPQKKAYVDLSSTMPLSNSSSKRGISGSKPRSASAEKKTSLFRNPNDHIYEEPEEMAGGACTVNWNDTLIPPPLTLKTRNSVTKVQVAREPLEPSATAPLQITNLLSRYDIHKNPPSQSRNPLYVENGLPLTPPDSASASDSDELTNQPAMNNGIEIRNKDIRDATSMRLKDRSPKLPNPTVVSDRPGRPIVSFDRNWNPREVELQHEDRSGIRTSSRDETTRLLPTSPRKPQLPAYTTSAPAIPTINIQVDEISAPPVPKINMPDIPSISVSTSPVPTVSTTEDSFPPRPLPKPNTTKARPLPFHSSTTPFPTSTPHWSPTTPRITAQCAACALRISGRIVSAASQRFHPECFSCFQCGELLECVAFYPEPDTFRSDRVARIRARATGGEVPSKQYDHSKHMLHPHPSEEEEEDGDEGLRFYCHLDFHEIFSPRCRSCKTPIEGEVVVACGGEWHVGHFFCAECGDPFDAQTPFVEKEGYAWCVECHTRRYSKKCAGCRRPVVDMVVKALGKEWHGECFCCVVSELFCPERFRLGEGLVIACSKKQADASGHNRSAAMHSMMAGSLLEARGRILFV